jgi:hypothetical protein
MQRNFRASGDATFLKGKYPISYRLLICHALMRQKTTLEACKALLNSMKQSIQNNKLFREPHFLEIIPGAFNPHQGGFVVVDRTKACFPLVFYPIGYSTNDKHGDRPKAFSNALKDVTDNIGRIHALLNKSQNWDVNTQKELFEILTFEKSQQKTVECSCCGGEYPAENVISEDTAGYICHDCAYQQQ